MSQNWPKVIRDPVHNIIPFQNDKCDRLLLALINTKEFQRLRRIKQLGVSNFVFPGADHTRFAHCIGVMHTAKMFLGRLEIVLGKRICEDHRTVVLAAALLHDVGHGPFSHAFEKITGDDHEKRTRQIITDKATAVNEQLGHMAGVLDNFFSEDVDESALDQEGFPSYLAQIVSSQLDADRFDYLLRDSYATGTGYGRFDQKWLLQNLFLQENTDRFYLGYKASLAVEQYVYSRYHMYRSVYFHKTTRAAEVMLRLLFRRLKELLDSGQDADARRRLVPGAPDTLLRAFSESISLSDYLMLDDHTIGELWKWCQYSSDATVRELGGGLLHRRLYKAIDVTGRPIDKVADFVSDARSLIADRALLPEYCLASDTPEDTPYKPYDPDSEKPAKQIYVEDVGGTINPLTANSDFVHPLTRKYTLTRYYCPESLRDDIRRLAENKLGRE
ncbi:MAG: HD domain-containing protein [Thermoguttaceae bacterium]|jgi:HD superfamily phosphohydrolase|nr:HD domain-containing protein [Thermoguttaceae bacterium]